MKKNGENERYFKKIARIYREVNGVGSQQPKGQRKKFKLETFKKGGAYHKDYGIDKSTGKVYGHNGDNSHGKYPHINIKRTDGKNVIINIIGEKHG